MKIDLSKVNKVTILDEKGKVIADIKPGQITYSTSKTGNFLEIKEEPKKKSRNPNLLRH